MTETWQQGVDYTFKTRYAWKHGTGAVAARINCRHFTDFASPDLLLSDINKKFIRAYQMDMEDREIPNGSINRRVSVITTVLNHLNYEDEISFGAPRIKQYKESQGRPWFFTKDEVDWLCSHTQNRLSELIRFASCTGGRVSELLSLKVQDVDLDKQIIYFGGRPNFNTKNGDWRTLPVAPQLLEILSSRCEGTPKDVLVFGDEWPNDSSVLHYFKKAVKQLGKEPHYVFHSLRHSFATWAVESKVPLRVLMSLMGHKNYNTTLRYAKTTDSARDEAISSIFN